MQFVPLTGAKGLNLAACDTRYLTRTGRFYAGDKTGINHHFGPA